MQPIYLYGAIAVEGRKIAFMIVREYTENDIPKMIEIWNGVVDEGNAFPQEEMLTNETGKDFFASQTFCGVATEAGSNNVIGL